MSDYREACNEAKAVRRGIVEARPVRSRAVRRAKKDVVVEIRYPNLRDLLGMREWHKFGAYETTEIAQQVIDNKLRGGHGRAEYRIKPATNL